MNFVRHGKTEWNAKHLCQGQLDIPLSNEGREEVRALAKSLNSSFTTIYTSPLKRALETAQILQNVLSIPSLVEIEELKERAWGELEGKSNIEMYRIEEAEEKKLPIPKIKGLEDREAFKRRIEKGMNRISSKGESSLIVSHGRVFLCLCELFDIPLVRQIPNATLFKLPYE